MDLEQLQRLVDRQSAALVLFASQWTDAPDDCVQEALVRLIRQDPPPRDPAAWLYRVVRNEAFNQARRQGRRRRREAFVARPESQPLAGSPVGLVDAQEAAAALDELDEPLRAVIVARIWGGLTFEQLGEALDVSTATALRRYTEGLSRLRERLQLPCPKNPSSRSN